MGALVFVYRRGYACGQIVLCLVAVVMAVFGLTFVGKGRKTLSKQELNTMEDVIEMQLLRVVEQLKGDK